MIKGTTKIELTDVKTGKKQVIEKHNTFTSALSQLFQPSLGHLTVESSLRAFAPCYSSVLGGILLFDEQIEETAANIFAPKGKKLIGCGKYNYVNSTVGKVMGSYNVTESNYDAEHKRMTFVYDFNTSQGNGTISSVCLTHLDAGNGAYGSDYEFSAVLCKSIYTAPRKLNTSRDKASTFSIGADYDYLFMLDSDNDIAYYFTAATANKVYIKRKKMGLKTYSLFSNDVELIDEIELANLSNGLTASYTTYNYDHDTNCLYLVATSSSTIAVNGTFVVTKINCSDWTVTQYSLRNTGDATITSSGRWAYVHQGFVYLRSTGTPYVVYKIEIERNANVSKFTGYETTLAFYPCFAINGKVYYQYSTTGDTNAPHSFVADGELNTFEMLGANSLYSYYYTTKPTSYTTNTYYVTPCYTPVKNHTMLYYLSYSTQTLNNFVYFGAYLGTINNLTEPVTKTIDKTMKITYVIEEV